MIISTDFQTPPTVCEYMANMIPDCTSGWWNILEPTPGIGNLVSAANKKGLVTAPAGDFWDFLEQSKACDLFFDYVIMNPPFTPMVEGVRYLEACMELSDNIIALLPWFIIINSDSRTKKLMDYGLVSITHLPRKSFPSSRIQCCILHLQKGYACSTLFHTFTFDK